MRTYTLRLHSTTHIHTRVFLFPASHTVHTICICIYPCHPASLRTYNRTCAFYRMRLLFLLFYNYANVVQRVAIVRIVSIA